MYDSLSNHDYDNPYQSGEIHVGYFFSIKCLIVDFISNSKPLNSSPESSSRSSGIYSGNDPRLSSSSSAEFYPNISNSNKSVSSSKYVSTNYICKQILHLFY